VDVLQPIISKFLVDNTVMARSVIEAMLVSDHANVCQATEEHECSKLELLTFRWCLEVSKEAASAFSFETDPARLEDAPNKTRTIEAVRSGCAPAIRRAQTLVNRSHQHRLIL